MISKSFALFFIILYYLYYLQLFRCICKSILFPIYRAMPEIDDLMEEWPAEVEEYLKEVYLNISYLEISFFIQLISFNILNSNLNLLLMILIVASNFKSLH